MPGADFVARVARALGETEKVPVPFVNHYRGYRLYISHIYRGVAGGAGAGSPGVPVTSPW